MPSINVRKESGLLYLDFRFRGVRCREQTLLEDTPANRDRLEKLLNRIERVIADGSFEYRRFFPDSPRAKQFGDATAAGPAPSAPAIRVATPIVSEFVETWFAESRPRWRRTNIARSAASSTAASFPTSSAGLWPTSIARRCSRSARA